MRFHTHHGQALPRNVVPICRLAAEGTHWRVSVESTQTGEGGVSGRFLFEPDGPSMGYTVRTSGPTLRAGHPEEVFAAAHEVSEERLRELLHSLS